MRRFKIISNSTKKIAKICLCFLFSWSERSVPDSTTTVAFSVVVGGSLFRFLSNPRTMKGTSVSFTSSVVVVGNTVGVVGIFTRLQFSPVNSR